MRKYVNTYRRTFEKNGKKHSKAPKIQRLVTPLTLQRKRRRCVDGLDWEGWWAGGRVRGGSQFAGCREDGMG